MLPSYQDSCTLSNYAAIASKKGVMSVVHANVMSRMQTLLEVEPNMILSPSILLCYPPWYYDSPNSNATHC